MAAEQVVQVVTGLGVQPLKESVEIFWKPDTFDQQYQLLNPKQTLAIHAEDANKVVRALTTHCSTRYH